MQEFIASTYVAIQNQIKIKFKIIESIIDYQKQEQTHKNTKLVVAREEGSGVMGKWGKRGKKRKGTLSHEYLVFNKSA